MTAPPNSVRGGLVDVVDDEGLYGTFADYWGEHSRMTKEVIPFLAEHLETGRQQ